MRAVIQRWWPLAASWILMSAELPALSAVIARLPDPAVNLAAYGGVVFPLALIIESPIIMLLAASTALSKDWASYAKLRRFMRITSAVMTAVHVLIAFTPLYDLVVVGLIAPPPEIVEPARVGLMIMTPWTFAIAYRRFNQGVLIRFGHSRAIGLGTMIRLGSNVTTLIAGFLVGTLPGIAVATGAVAVGVMAEALYVGLRVQPVLRHQLRPAEPVKPPLTFYAMMAFYIPLALTSLLGLIIRPIGSAAISRMPDALASLAVWSVVQGLMFMVQSLGTAYNEVVVAMLDEPGAVRTLRRFAAILAVTTTAAMVLLAATSLSRVWFETISALPPALADMARVGLWLTLPLPAISALQSWFQGSIVNSRRTRGITEAVMVFMAVNGVILVAGVSWGQAAGLYVGLAAVVVASIAQTAWLAWRSRGAMRVILARAAA